MHTIQHTANQQVALTMDADIQGGLFVKGYVFDAAQVSRWVWVCLLVRGWVGLWAVGCMHRTPRARGRERASKRSLD